ncbi:lipopolysaccharide biosynthesis protein [Faecalimonas sp.]
MKNRYKNIVGDLLYNTLGFGIYILTQQILLMPIMSRILSRNQFSKMTIYLSVYAILTNVFGSELGIVRQVRREDGDKSSDYNRILLQLLPGLLVVSCVGLRIFDFDTVEILFLTICILLGNFRLYSTVYFRLNHVFYKIVIQNIIYLAGICVGLFITYETRISFMPFFCAEFFCVFYDIKEADFEFRNIKKTADNKKIWIKFRDFSFISLLVNLTSYFDRIIIYPILGANAVTVYFATCSMSKVISLITNPLHGVILSWLKGNDVEFRNRITKIMIKISIPVIVTVFMISIPVTHLTLRILYPQYLLQATKLIIPICIGVAFSSMASITKGVLLKYVESKKLIYSYIIYIAILVILGMLLSEIYGIIGFAISTAIANIILSISFFLLLVKVSK